MRTAIICVWAAWLTIAFLVEFGLADVLTTKSGGQYEGTVTKDGDGYLLVKPDGSKMTFPAGMVAEVEKGPIRPTAASKPVKVPGAGANSGPSAGKDEKLIERVVTGIGTDPDKALQAAFSQAIESTVGVLVDAETVVKNDQIIKDQILTFSKGFIQKFEVVKQWQADGLHHATIKALVQTEKLVEKLKANNIASHEIPGELVARQIRFDFKNAEEASKILKRILDDFDIIRLTDIMVDGKPEIRRDGANATMTVRAKLTPKMEEWAKFSQNLRQLLEKAATGRGPAELRTAEDKDLVAKDTDSFWLHDNKNLAKQLGDTGFLIGVFKQTNMTGDKISVDLFRVPEPLEDAIKATVERLSPPQVTFVLLDKDGQEVSRTSTPVMQHAMYQWEKVPMRRETYMSPAGHWWPVWWIGPMWCRECRIPFAVRHVDGKLVLSTEDLARVVNVQARLESVARNR